MLMVIGALPSLYPPLPYRSAGVIQNAPRHHGELLCLKLPEVENRAARPLRRSVARRSWNADIARTDLALARSRTR